MSDQNTRVRASDELKREFARRLLAKLEERDMNQSDLAKSIGMSKDAVSTYARGRSLPSQDTMKKIGKALNCSPDELLPKRYDSVNTTPDLYQLTALKAPGMAHLSINAELPSKLAFKIVNLLHDHIEQTSDSD